MDPKTNWKLVMLDSLYRADKFYPWNSLGSPLLLLFYGWVAFFCLLNHDATFSGVFTDYRYFPGKVIFLSCEI